MLAGCTHHEGRGLIFSSGKLAQAMPSEFMEAS